MDEWQPIETAPKDGTWILAYRDADGFSRIPNVIFWDESGEEWLGATAESDTRAAKHPPTHWLAFKLPPEVDAND